MKILVTGGSGVIGAAVIRELLSRGHEVRLLSRHASEDAKEWNGVEAREGDVADASSLNGAATACGAVVHIAGIVAEEPPHLTFAKVNVGGTRNMIAEAARAGARRFIYISSLGADTGETDYHKSKLDAERVVEKSDLDWVVVRPGNVYGPGDEVISTVLKMVRALPAVPVIDDGEQPFQPIWFEDLGRAVATIIERSRLNHTTLEISGPDVTTMNDLIDRLKEVTGRHPLRVPVPMAIAAVTTKIASAAARFPIDETKLQMLKEKNVLRDGAPDMLADLGVTPTSLDDGLRKLADSLLEVLPEDGVGRMQHKTFYADIAGSRMTATQLMADFKENVNEVMPIEFSAEPGAPTKIESGTTLTGSLPLRGNFQVRVEVAEPTRVVFATIEGHPLAGIVQFTTSGEGALVRFAVDVYSRASNFLDLIAIRTVGESAQSANWRTVVQRMVDRSGGTSDGVHTEAKTLEDDEAAAVEKSVRRIVQKRQRDESPSAEDSSQR